MTTDTDEVISDATTWLSSIQQISMLRMSMLNAKYYIGINSKESPGYLGVFTESADAILDFCQSVTRQKNSFTQNQINKAYIENEELRKKIRNYNDSRKNNSLLAIPEEIIKYVRVLTREVMKIIQSSGFGVRVTMTSTSSASRLGASLAGD